MSAERRQAAIEAGAQALDRLAWRGRWTNPRLQEYAQGAARDRAAIVVNAAAPYLVGEPVGYVVVSDRFGAVSQPHIFESLAAAREEAGLLEKARGGGHTVVALLPVEES